MGGLKFGEILIILVVVLLLFGKDRLPGLGSSLGEAIRNFKRGFGGEDEKPAEPRPNGMMASTTTVEAHVDPAKAATKQS